MAEPNWPISSSLLISIYLSVSPSAIDLTSRAILIICSIICLIKTKPSKEIEIIIKIINLKLVLERKLINKLGKAKLRQTRIGITDIRQTAVNNLCLIPFEDNDALLAISSSRIVK